MKLQYLGDSRDAFKWDLLHWLCTESVPQFAQLVFVPMLTPDDPTPTDGRTPHARFPCRPKVREFVASLRALPLTLDRIRALGQVEPTRPFEVRVAPGNRHIGSGPLRAAYWAGWSASACENSVLFFDPDNGFETKTRRGPKWIRHLELATILASLPYDSAAVVYQHRPQRRPWQQVLAGLRSQLTYAPFAAAVHEANLAFVILAPASAIADRIGHSAKAYCAGHPSVRYALIRSSGGEESE